MKTKSSVWVRLLTLLFAAALLVVQAAAADPPIPIVHILATDPCGAEAGAETATLTVVRDGPTNAPLTVLYGVIGSAENGVDYQMLSGSVTIPACATSARITITPIDDSLIEGGEVVLAVLVQPLVWPPPYIVCWPSFAFAHIEDNDFEPTNRPPAVALVNPPDGSVFMAPADIRLAARASDSDGRVRTVEFFEGTNSLGIVTNPPPFPPPLPVDPVELDPSFEVDAEAFPDLEIAPGPIDPAPLPTNPFHLLWENIRPGHYILTAVATDNDGTHTRSAPVDIRVTEPPSQPFVNLVARDPVAAEPGPATNELNTATFVVTRTGDTALPLTVFYRVGGTASNGVDYAELPHSVTIDAGARGARIVVAPLDDDRVEGPESVVLRLVPPLCLETYPPPPDCYLVGRHHTARAVIRDNDTPPNRPPLVRLVRPLDGSVFLAPADVGIAAQARDPDGRVVSVEFFEGTNSLGVVSHTPALLTSARPPFHLIWSNVPPGHYVLMAEATDNDGASTLSEPVEIKVVERTLPPVVSIVATDAEAAEAGGLNNLNSVSNALNTATFTVSRTGDTDRPLRVQYSIGGTAGNGVDYRRLSGKLLIPSNAASALIVIHPIDDRLVEGAETVGITLEPSSCLALATEPTDCYRVGTNSRAKAVIRDNDVSPTNQPPKVALVRPEDGDVFLAPADIGIVAEARDGDGFVRHVEFFANGTSLGVVSNALGVVSLSNIVEHADQLFRFRWENVPPGGYVLTAKATDNDGAMSLSEPVRIKVIEPPLPPVVTIEARDPYASEGDLLVLSVPDGPELKDVLRVLPAPIPAPPRTAAFVVQRTGRTNLPLTVHYRLSGTAVNGLDYQLLSGDVTIPSGARAAVILVRPIDDALPEGTETVIATLEPVACPLLFPPPPECYVVGDPARARAYIRDNDFNHSPRVAILSPRPGQVFEAPGQIPILVHAADPDGWVTRVEFFEGSNSIGVQEMHFIVPPPPGRLQEFTLRWTNVPEGQYTLTAVATDNEGATTRSVPVRIEVAEADLIPVVGIIARDPIAREGTTNTATFRLRRSGPTNDALTVHYTVRGTASNGVDYVSIPGMVTIPAGRRSARIVITPLDDNLPERIETVVLRLEDAALYNVGPLRRAAALILDNDHPEPGCRRLPDGLIHLCLPHLRGYCYRIEASSDLVNWETLFINTVAEDALHFTDADSDAQPHRFFRVTPDLEITEDE